MGDDLADLWVFGYGSLMWRPGFPFAERRHAHLYGYHRSLCVFSHVHRGTPERPGLVLGLDRGGRCHGVAFRVLAAEADATIRYLREREQVTAVYLERSLPITLSEGGQVQGSKGRCTGRCALSPTSSTAIMRNMRAVFRTGRSCASSGRAKAPQGPIRTMCARRTSIFSKWGSSTPFFPV